jgi:hypothetical protein
MLGEDASLLFSIPPACELLLLGGGESAACC